MAASAGEVELSVVPEVSAFGQLLMSGITRQLGGMEMGVSKLVSGLLGNALPLAFAAAGVAATKMASDYEDALAKIEGLVGLTHEQTVQLGDDMLELSKTIPVAPEELAKAMFFIESAGLRGAKAMDALEFSAKASAAGLGDIMTVADAVTSAMNSYAQSGLSAGEATDIMVAAVREGKMAPEELAGALGQVLPVASQMGVEFEEVAAAIASATRQGLSSARAATGVRFLLTAFIKPSQQAVEALGSVGMSIEELQTRLEKKGLLNVLQTLSEKFDLTTATGKQMFAQVVGGARGLSVASILVGENGEAIQKVFDNIANSAGSTEHAFEVAMETLTKQFALLVTTVKATAIAIGEVLLPIITTIVHILSAVLSPVLAFVARNAKAVTIAFLAWYGLKSLPAIINGISRAIEFLGQKMTMIKGAIVVTALIEGFRTVSAALKTSLDDVRKSSDKLFPPSFTDKIEESSTGFVSLTTAMVQGRGPADEFNQKIDVLKGAIEDAGKAGYDTAAATDYLSTHAADVMRIFEKFSGDPVAAQEALLGAIERNTASTEEQALAAEKAAGGFLNIKKTMETVHPVFDALGLDFDEFVNGARDAALKGEKAFSDFSAKTLQDVGKAIQSMQQDISSSLNFTVSALQEVSQKSHATASDYLEAFGKARKQTQEFGKDLLEIAHHGGPELARQLISMGEEGVRAASVIAGASDKMRDKLIGSFNAGQTEADKLATKLTKSIAGSLDEIATLLRRIAKSWGINVEMHDEATSKIQSISSGLLQLTAHDWEIRVHAKEVKGSPTPSELIKQLTTKLEDLTGETWNIKIHAFGAEDEGLKFMSAQLKDSQKLLDKLGSAADEVFGQEFPKAYQKDVEAFEKATKDKVNSFEKQMSQMQKTFDKLQSKVKDFQDSIKSGFADVSDLVGGSLDAIQKHQEELANLREQGWVGEDWGSGVGDFLAQQVAGAQDFATKLAQLSAAGLAPAVLAEIAQQGPEALPLVDALLAGGKDLITQFNDAQKTIKGFADVTAQALGEQQFGGALKKARNQIENLNNSIEHFVNQFRNHTENLADSIQKLAQALNQSIAQLGGKVPKMATGGIVTKPTIAMVGEAGPEAIIPLGKGAGTGGDVINVYLNVEGNAVYSKDLAAEVRDVLLKDKRYKGTLGLS